MNNKPPKGTPLKKVANERMGQARKMRGYLPHYLSRLMNAMNLRLMVELRVHRMTISQFRVIQMLDARGSAAIGEIAADTVIEQSVVVELSISWSARTSLNVANGRATVAVSMFS